MKWFEILRNIAGGFLKWYDEIVIVFRIFVSRDIPFGGSIVLAATAAIAAASALCFWCASIRSHAFPSVIILLKIRKVTKQPKATKNIKALP